MTAEHQIDEATRKASRWNADEACYATLDGRAWRYTSDPQQEGVEWRDASGEPLAVAVWLQD